MVVTSVTGHIMELDFDASVRSWHSCDPVDLFTAPVCKRIRGDETQKKIEKTLLKEARQSQVRGWMDECIALAWGLSWYLVAVAVAVAGAVAGLRSRGGKHRVRSQKHLRKVQQEAARVSRSVFGTHPSRYYPCSAELGRTQRETFNGSRRSI